MIPWNIARYKVHDASGINNPNDYNWYLFNGIYYPNIKTMEELAEQILFANDINWIPISYVYDVRACENFIYELSLISGGVLKLKFY